MVDTVEDSFSIIGIAYFTSKITKYPRFDTATHQKAAVLYPSVLF